MLGADFDSLRCPVWFQGVLYDKWLHIYCMFGNEALLNMGGKQVSCRC